MTTCLKKRMFNSIFTNQFYFVTKYKIDTRVYPAVEVKVSNSLPAFEFISASHQLAHLPLKSSISTEQIGEVSSIFVKVTWRL